MSLQCYTFLSIYKDISQQNTSHSTLVRCLFFPFWCLVVDLVSRWIQGVTGIDSHATGVPDSIYFIICAHANNFWAYTPISTMEKQSIKFHKCQRLVYIKKNLNQGSFEEKVKEQLPQSDFLPSSCWPICTSILPITCNIYKNHLQYIICPQSSQRRQGGCGYEAVVFVNRNIWLKLWKTRLH